MPTEAREYYGDRTKSSLTTFAMQFVKSKVTELWQGLQFWHDHLHLSS